MLIVDDKNWKTKEEERRTIETRGGSHGMVFDFLTEASNGGEKSREDRLTSCKASLIAPVQRGEQKAVSRMWSRGVPKTDLSTYKG